MINSVDEFKRSHQRKRFYDLKNSLAGGVQTKTEKEKNRTKIRKVVYNACRIK